jgi:PBP1b-binding outer membrane lipoprotein LpoB
MKKRSILFLTLLAAFILAGCTTPPKPEAKKAADDEYVYLPPATGSHVQRKVLKSDLLAGKVPNDDAAQSVDKDQFARGINPGQKMDNGH